MAAIQEAHEQQDGSVVLGMLLCFVLGVDDEFRFGHV